MRNFEGEVVDVPISELENFVTTWSLEKYVCWSHICVSLLLQ